MTKARERKTAITTIKRVLDYSELVVRNNRETFCGGPQATATRLACHLSLHQASLVISPSRSACHAPFPGLSSGPAPLLSAALPPSLPTPTATAGHRGCSVTSGPHCSMEFWPFWPWLSPTGLCLHQLVPFMHFWVHSCPGQSARQKRMGQETNNTSLNKEGQML